MKTGRISLAFFLVISGFSCKINLETSNPQEDAAGNAAQTPAPSPGNAQDQTAGYNPDSVPVPEAIANPAVTLKREYWKVFKNNESPVVDACYLLPRPDGSAPARAACASTDPMVTSLKQYDICAQSPSLSVINQIPCEKALEIAAYLHKFLSFKDASVYPEYKDRADACSLPRCRDDSSLKGYCEYYKRKASETISTNEARLDTDEEKAAMGVCLNELYGITGG